MISRYLLLNTQPKTQKMLIAPSGRTFYRHSSGMGTVMCFNDGQDREVLVLDAAYRGYGDMGDWGDDISLPDYDEWNISRNWYIHGTNSSTTPAACASITDATLNSLWVNTIDVNTAKHNCDVILAEASITPTAVTYARSILVNGTPCDVPNIQTLQRIYCDSEFLDSMDPTVDEYPHNALGSANSYCPFAVGGSGNTGVAYDKGNADCWSSTDGGIDKYDSSSWGINSYGICKGNYDDGYGRDYSLGVVPILEL